MKQADPLFPSSSDADCLVAAFGGLPLAALPVHIWEQIQKHGLLLCGCDQGHFPKLYKKNENPVTKPLEELVSLSPIPFCKRMINTVLKTSVVLIWLGKDPDSNFLLA